MFSQVLKNLASKGKVVVCTVHQPSSQVFALFDRVLLMTEGRTAFMGTANKALEFFASQVEYHKLGTLSLTLDIFL